MTERRPCPECDESAKWKVPEGPDGESLTPLVMVKCANCSYRKTYYNGEYAENSVDVQPSGQAGLTEYTGGKE